MKMVVAIISLGCNSYKYPDVEVGPQRPLQSSTKHITWNSKISVNLPLILQPFWAK